MTLEQLLDGGPQISVTVSAKDLRQFADDLIAKAHSKLQSATVDELMTPGEVATKLRVNLSTLYRWHKSGYLVMIEVGGNRRYRAGDVEAIINQRTSETE